MPPFYDEDYNGVPDANENPFASQLRRNIERFLPAPNQPPIAREYPDTYVGRAIGSKPQSGSLDWRFSELEPGQRPKTDSTLIDYDPAQGTRAIAANESEGGGGFGPSQMDWSKVANPMAFEAYRERPEIAKREADISLARTLERDPFARERFVGERELELYGGKRAIDTAEMGTRRTSFQDEVNDLQQKAEAKIAEINTWPVSDKEKNDAITNTRSRLETLRQERAQAYGFAEKAKADPFAGLGRS